MFKKTSCRGFQCALNYRSWFKKSTVLRYSANSNLAPIVKQTRNWNLDDATSFILWLHFGSKRINLHI